MKLAIAVALATAGALFLVAPAFAAPRANGLTQDLSAAKKVVVVKKKRVVRHYEAPKYYGYYGPTYYERPYARPAPLVFGVGGWW